MKAKIIVPLALATILIVAFSLPRSHQSRAEQKAQWAQQAYQQECEYEWHQAQQWATPPIIHLHQGVIDSLARMKMDTDHRNCPQNKGVTFR